MYSNQASEVDEVYLHDISGLNPSSMENCMISAKSCIDYDHFDPDLPVSNNLHKRKDRSVHLKSSQRPCKIADYRQKKEIVKDLEICNEEKKQEEIVHVRAKRGQATNSHSLAERVRREKIGERMRFLQDLVPGCNKIIGKAMMLDEIINYVQSLQRQIEFLSMKLAALCPEANVDLQQIFSRDMLFQSNFGASNLYGLTPQIVANSNNIIQLEKPYSAATLQIPGSLDFDLQSILQMGFCNQKQ